MNRTITTLLLVMIFINACAQKECSISIKLDNSPVYFMNLTLDSILVYDQMDHIYKFNLVDCNGSGYFTKTNVDGEVLEFGSYKGSLSSFKTDTLGVMDIVTEEIVYKPNRISYPKKDGVWYLFDQKTKKPKLLRFKDGILIEEIEMSDR